MPIWGPKTLAKQRRGCQEYASGDIIPDTHSSVGTTKSSPFSQRLSDAK